MECYKFKFRKTKSRDKSVEAVQRRIEKQRNEIRATDEIIDNGEIVAPEINVDPATNNIYAGTDENALVC